MEEQKNLNNPLASQPAATTEQKNIPTAAGVLIILVVAVIVGAGIFYFFQNDFSDSSYNNSVVSSESLKSKTETADIKEGETASQDQVEAEVIPPVTGEAFNFDYELKKLDDQNNAVSSDDFNENEMSDVNIGL
jgi:uncharacterized protein HemX